MTVLVRDSKEFELKLFINVYTDIKLKSMTSELKNKIERLFLYRNCYSFAKYVRANITISIHDSLYSSFNSLLEKSYLSYTAREFATTFAVATVSFIFRSFFLVVGRCIFRNRYVEL